MEDRLVSFAVAAINLTNQMKTSYPSKHLASQLARSATSAALNYGETRSAESKRDFIHKMKVLLKELRESFINLRIVKEGALIQEDSDIDLLIKENNELISIFVKSVHTAQTRG